MASEFKTLNLHNILNQSVYQIKDGNIRISHNEWDTLWSLIIGGFTRNNHFYIYFSFNDLFIRDIQSDFLKISTKKRRRGENSYESCSD